MKKITIKDIAKLANVSHGTVSNVLNNNGNVSAEKIDAVMKAAREVGYQLNVRASALRSNEARSIAVVLPNMHSEQCTLFYEGFLSEIHTCGIAINDVDLFISQADINTEKEIILKISSKVYKNIIVFSALEDAQEWYDKTNIPQENIIFIYHCPRNAINTLGLDYRQAGKDIAQKLPSGEKVSLFCESDKYSYISELIAGLHTTDKNEITHTFTDGYFLHNDAINLVHSTTSEIFITTSQRKANKLLAALNLTRRHTNKKIFLLGTIDTTEIQNELHYYQMEYFELGRQAGSRICNTSALMACNITNPGFTTEPQLIISQHHPMPLKILMNSSPSSEAIKKIAANFCRRSGIDIEIDTPTSDEVNKILADEDKVSHYDIVRLDIALLPWFSQRLLTPLDEIIPEANHLVAGYEENIIELTAKVNGTLYAIPFDVGPQMLFYRKDLFEDSKIKRLFYEKYGDELTVPVTFEEYDRICRFFNELNQATDTGYPSGATSFEISPELLASEFLLRYYSNGGVLITGKDYPSIDVHIGSHVLTHYISYLATTHKTTGLWWDAAVKNFEAGKTALLITYANLLNNTAHGPMRSVLGCAPVPQSVSQLGGGSLGITRYSKMKPAALTFINWLNEDYIVEHRVLLGSGCMSKQAFKNHLLRNTYPWMHYFNEMNFNVIRETTDANNAPYNILEAEYIIGVHLMHAVHATKTTQAVIEDINKELHQHFSRLYHNLTLSIDSSN